jgi:hypothetical protein
MTFRIDTRPDKFAVTILGGTRRLWLRHEWERLEASAQRTCQRFSTQPIVICSNVRRVDARICIVATCLVTGPSERLYVAACDMKPGTVVTTLTKDDVITDETATCIACLAAG